MRTHSEEITLLSGERQVHVRHNFLAFLRDGALLIGEQVGIFRQLSGVVDTRPLEKLLKPGASPGHLVLGDLDEAAPAMCLVDIFQDLAASPIIGPILLIKVCLRARLLVKRI